MRGCLSETELLEFLDGRLGSEALAGLEQHLDTCGQCRELLAFMAHPSAASMPHRVAGKRAGGPTFVVGEMVAGRHRIVRFIAEGGMGEVYEALDTLLGERVALKTVGAARSDDPDFADRLKREVQLARKVTHPNVCRIFDVGLHETGSPAPGPGMVFLTMELIDGETLGKRLRATGKLSPEAALPLVAQIGAALDAAHQAGIIHRDLKSDNVLLDGERAVVTDFGLAEANADREQEILANDGLAVGGTPHYMAPEQALGEAVTSSADIYALGVVIYEMVTGSLPFAAGSAPFSVVARRLGYQPVSPAIHAPELPARWVRTILRCLERDPRRRFLRARDVVTALSPPRRARIAAGSLAALVASAGAAYATLSPRHPAIAPCPPLDLAAGHVYVDASAARPGSGAGSCPFRTITAALDATAKASGHHTIHVAAGQYDAALGERFPLMVRGDTSLVGAGDRVTSIVGTAPFDSTIGGGNLGSSDVTLVIGDATAPTELSGITFAPGAGADRAFGVLCDRGNDGPLDADERPPSTRISESTFGPGYGNGIVAAQTTGQGGCNLSVFHDRFRKSIDGIWMVGCGAEPTPPQAVSAVVEGSTFTEMRSDAEPGGAGVNAWDCTDRLRVKSSVFGFSDSGIMMTAHLKRAHGLIVEDSDFASLSKQGVYITRQAFIERLTGSTFRVNSAGAVAFAGRRSVGLRIDTSLVAGDTPAVLLARNNTWNGNDIGIELEGHVPLARTLDFGRPDDPGKNIIRCNGTLPGSTVPGHDLLIDVPIDPGAKLLFAGNTWDHAPPTSGDEPNGADIASPAGIPSIDTSGAIAGKAACGDGLP